MKAVAFDFNGTLSDDEPILVRVYQEQFAELGRPITETEYFEQLAGHTDEEMYRLWFGESRDEWIEDRVDRYIALAADGSTVLPENREAVRFAAAIVPVAIVSAALRREIDAVVDGAGIRDALSAIVSQDDVTNGKPNPECYLTAARLLEVAPGDLLAFEDTPTGVLAAKTAGARVVALTSTVGAERLRDADELVERIDRALLERLLCS
jgi:beta-phosphoglucomutase-like phosphatase (HAD superfamily)